MLELFQPLEQPTALPLKTIDTLASSALVVAPHPDDECLGCGGTIALLRSRYYQVNVLVMTDGTRSHPNSRKFPAPVLRAMRESETQAAMIMLGVDPAAITFLKLPDGTVPTSDAPEFDQIVSRCAAYLQTTSPQLIFLPWRFDPHPDHRASWQIIQSALNSLDAPSPRIVEYPIWDWDSEQRGSIPAHIQAWRLDIHSVIQQKQQAITAYRSQISNLIDDDPEGFRLSPEMLENFTHPWEIYLEENSCSHF